MPLRLGVSRRLVQFTSTSVSTKVEPFVIPEVEGLLLQNESGLVVAQNGDFIVRQESTKNALLTQASDILILQNAMAEIGLNE